MYFVYILLYIVLNKDNKKQNQLIGIFLSIKILNIWIVENIHFD